MATALERILEYKRDEVAALKASASVESLEKLAACQTLPRGFAAALSDVAETDDNALICELKRKSPSAGDILPGADPVDIAKDYEAGGAACLSILTDGPSFGGCLEDLAAVRNAVSIPLIRKDFMIDPLQVIEARAHGADAILIIMAAIGDGLANELCTAAVDYGMDALVEVHDRGELDRALALDVDLIGVNNRDLKQMTTDLGVTEALAPRIPPGRALVSESGVKTPDDIARLRKTGARRFLIGESLMKQTDRRLAVSTLRRARTFDE